MYELKFQYHLLFIANQTITQHQHLLVKNDQMSPQKFKKIIIM